MEEASLPGPSRLFAPEYVPLSKIVAAELPQSAILSLGAASEGRGKWSLEGKEVLVAPA